MNTKNMTMMIVSLAIGVIMIAGVVTPVIANVVGSSESSGEPVTNDGPRMGILDNTLEKYDIHSVYAEGGREGYYPTIGSKMLTFYNDSGTLKMAVVTLTGEDSMETTEITSITESCILLYAPDHIIAYDSVGNRITYALKEDGSSVGSGLLSSLGELRMVYMSQDGSKAEEQLTYSFGISSYVMNGWFSSTDGYLYDTEGDYVSAYGQSPIYYDVGNLVYGYLNGRNPQDNPMPIIGYTNTGMFIQNSDDYQTPTITDNHTTMDGHNYIDSEHTFTIHVEESAQSTTYDEVCNVFIAPRTIGSEGGSGVGVSGTLATIISVIPLIMAVGLVIGTIGYIKMKN